MLIVLYRQNGKEIDQLLKDLCSKLDISYTYQKECNRIILEKGLILSRLVDTFFSRISPTMQLPPKHHSIAYVLPWAEGLHWQSRSSGCSNS